MIDDDAPIQITNAYGRFAMIPSGVLMVPGLSNNAKLLYVHLWDFSTGGGGRIFPSRKTLAERMGSSVSSIKRWLTELIEAGVVSKSPTYRGDGSQSSNNYTLIQLAGGVHGWTGGGSPVDRGGFTHEPPDQDPVTKTHITSLDAPKRKRETAHQLPANWAPNERHAALASARGVNLARETEMFRLHAEANARRAVRWDAAFTMWLNKALPPRGQQSAPEAKPFKHVPFVDPYKDMPSGEFGWKPGDPT